MKALQSKIPKSLPIGAIINCDDNSGAKVVQIIGMLKAPTKRRRKPSVGIGDVAIVAVKKGSPQMIKKVEKALIIRQRKPFRRANGVRIMFEDNACALIDDAGLPKGTEIKGVVAREIVDRYPKVAGIAWSII
ncbi:MAG: uL14 family ribosomal protein [Candidatus Micrarchaeia archaeon]